MKYSKNVLTSFLNALLLCSSIAFADSCSKSFFTPRSITTDSVFELALTTYDRYCTETDDTTYSFYLKPFIMQSSNNAAVARYFLPHNNECIRVDQTGNGDIDPLWFNIISPAANPYKSTICFSPVRTAYGLLFSFYAHFCSNWWAGIHTTLMQVNHSLGIVEMNRTADGILPGFKTMCDGFNDPAWQAGKLSCCACTKGGLDDIQLKLGYDFYTEHANRLSPYGVATIPTGARPTSQWVFEPLVGSKQGSFGFGCNGSYTVCRNENLTLLADVKYRYVCNSEECRSFDLCKNGDWSRYLLISTASEPLNSKPGINLFTLPVTVTPGSTIDAWLALHYQQCNCDIEIGYDFWWRQKERLSLDACIAPGFGIQTFSLFTPTVTSASNAGICQTAPGAGSNVTVSDPTFVTLTTQDLDVDSASHPRAISQTLYIDIGYTLERKCASFLCGLGFSYEIATNKNALTQWTIWYTQGVLF